MSDESIDREQAHYAAGRPTPEPICQFPYFAVDRALEAAETPPWRREQLERMRRAHRQERSSTVTPISQ